jgi:hypothetical protein
LSVLPINSRLPRGRRVILDSDLATLYGVAVSVFNQAVKRNAERFPADFAFQLTREEYDSLRSQSVISKNSRGAHRKYLPRVFTEHGAVMAASVLNSPKAVEMSVEVVRCASGRYWPRTASSPPGSTTSNGR